MKITVFPRLLYDDFRIRSSVQKNQSNLQSSSLFCSHIISPDIDNDDSILRMVITLATARES